MKTLEYIPIISDPGKSIPTRDVQTREPEGTPLMDFLMSLSGYMRLAAAGAAVLLTMAVALGA